MTIMTAPSEAANLVATSLGLYAGVDTHKDTHPVAVVDELGRAVADQQFPATGTGYRQTVEFLHSHGGIRAVGVEGTGSYGAGLARALAAAGMIVVEVMRTKRQHRRIKGKSDQMDAHQAALAVAADLSAVAPKHRDGHVESLRILLAERASATKACTAVMNQIHALLITAEDKVRAGFRRYHGEKLVAVLARTRPVAGHEPEQVARGSLKRLATRHRQFTAEIADLDVRSARGHCAPAQPGAVGRGGRRATGGREPARDDRRQSRPDRH